MAEPVAIDGVNYDRYLGWWDQDGPTLIGRYGGGVVGPAGATLSTATWRTALIGPRWVLLDPLHKVWMMRGLYKAGLATNHPDNLGIFQNGPQGTYPYTPAPQPGKIGFPGAAQYGAMARYQQRRPNDPPKYEMACLECRRLRSWHINCGGEDTIPEYKAGNSVGPASSVFNATSFPSSGGAGKNWWGGDHVAASSGNYPNPEGLPYYHFTQGGLYAGGKPLVAGNDPVKIVYQHLPPYIPAALGSRIFMDVFDPQFRQHCLAYGAITTGSDYAAFVQVDDGDYVYGFGHGHRNETGFQNMSSDAKGRVSPHLAYLFLVANPTPATQKGTIPGSQAAPTPINFQPQNQKMFTKFWLRDFLKGRYNGSISALNAAWKSNYTTWDSNGGWQVGSGFLDEDGRSAHTWLGSASLPNADARWIDSTSWNPQVTVDLNDALYEIAKKYFGDVKLGVTRNNTLLKLYAGHSYIVTWGYPARKPVVRAASEVLDILPSATPVGSETEAVYNYLLDNAARDVPFVDWMLSVARIDSGLYYLGASGYATQSARAQGGFIAPMNRALNFKSKRFGTFPWVGFHHFEENDKRSEQGAWGWRSRRGNPYNGKDYTSRSTVDDLRGPVEPGFPQGRTYPIVPEDGPAYASTDPGLPTKVFGDFVGPASAALKALPAAFAAQYAGGAPPDTGNLAGTVSEKTTPLAGVSVTAGTQSTTTGADGKYSFTGLLAGSYTLKATKAGYDPVSQTVTVTKGQTTTVNLTMTPTAATTGSVAGTVHETGAVGRVWIIDLHALKPIAGATVTASGKSATTDAAGAYRLDQLAPGAVTVTATAAGYEAATMTGTVTAGQVTTVDLALTPTPEPPDPADQQKRVALLEAEVAALEDWRAQIKAVS